MCAGLRQLCAGVPRVLVFRKWHSYCRDRSSWKELNMRKFDDQKGKIGYIILWFLGVPASVLFLIFLLRGCT